MKKDKEENPNEPENGELEHKVSMADQFIYDTASLYSTINPTQFCFRKQQYIECCLITTLANIMSFNTKICARDLLTRP